MFNEVSLNHNAVWGTLTLTKEMLRQEAHELALKHDPFMKRRSSKQLAKSMESDMNSLKYFVRQLHEHRLTCMQPAEEWLLDNAEFIESEVLAIHKELTGQLLKQLPYVSDANAIRIYDICYHYLKQNEGQLHIETFMDYVRAYQEVAVLKLAEIWAIPLMIRIAAIRQLAEMMDTIKERRAVCQLVERVLADIPASQLSPETLKNALQEAGQEMPLSGALIAHLVQHLREHADDMANVGEWLMCKLENGEESLDRILALEYQLQATYHMMTGNLIDAMRLISRRNWRDVFEQLSIVEQTLREEQAGDYALMDAGSRHTVRMHVAKLAARLNVPENLVATQAVQLANTAYEREMQSQDASGQPRTAAPLGRPCFAAYYVLDSEGLAQLHRALKLCGETRPLPEVALLKRATGTYFNALLMIFLIGLAVFSFWLGYGLRLNVFDWFVVMIALLIPVSEWAVQFVHWSIERVKQPVRLLRYDFSNGIPPEAATLIVIPVIWSTPEDVVAVAERLELHYLANREEQLYFALLGDFKDATAERLPEDEQVIRAAQAEMKRLHDTYPEGKFYFFQRKRKWNDAENMWMGWERKRGKLVEFVELLKGSEQTSYSVTPEQIAELQHVKYIITLDADTQMPLESAQRMVGAMHLTYNRPRLNKGRTRVVEGYGVLQPRIGITHEASQRSRLSALWSAEPGIDPYAFAVCDPYQDGLGEGIFTGKGIFDVDTFYEVLCERIPNNRVLSHDLLEGGFLRAGLLSDIELIDDHPVTFNAYQKRLHRWVRGDWQLLIWLLPRVETRSGELLPVGLSMLTRWQMVDNLRRSLLLPSLMALFIIAVLWLPGSPLRWFTFIAITLLLPTIKQAFNWYTLRYNMRGLLVTLGHAFVTLVTLPYQSFVHCHAIVVTLYRLAISKQHLLEWTSQAEVERRSKHRDAPLLLGLYGGYVLIAIFFFAALLFYSGADVAWMIGLSVLWLLAPLAIRWLDETLSQQQLTIGDVEREELIQLSRDMWQYYVDTVTAEDHWLPPDNVQIEPHVGVAHRTSPTNIGMYLNCALAARDFGFITTAQLVTRLAQTLQSIEQMEKWEGHLYNWYDTQTLLPLQPQFVSTVDSGNFIACLMAVKQGLSEWLHKEQEEGEQSEEEREIIERGNAVLAQLEQLIVNTNFRALYNEHSELFSLGYSAGEQRTEAVLYDLLASEARQASFVAIALGQVPVSHWHVLGRTMTKVGQGQKALLSWTGTMFEYLMPWLLMRTFRNTIWDATYRAVVDRQIAYARERDIPFGISESGYYAFDYQLNYQYKAFGVPGLGFKRGLEREVVTAPYATIMALPFAKDEAFEALRTFAKLGGRGQYGYYEAVDFSQKRMPAGKSHMVIQSFMAHHIGMSMLTISNVLNERSMVDRFHSDKRVRAAELLLQERMPKRPALIDHHAMHRVHEPYTRTEQLPTEQRQLTTAHTDVPEVCILSNGSFTTVLTNSGSGFSRYKGLNVSRWREDAVRDPWGSYVYIRDVTAEKIWSPSYQPCRVESPQQRIQFELDRVEFSRTDGDVQTTMEICVSPEWQAEVRKLTLKNTSREAKVLEVTTFIELALANPIADDAHPAFSKLFIRTDYEEEAQCLVAGRRAREASDRTIWGAHALYVSEQPSGAGQLEYDTDRSSFIGRGHSLAAPQAIRTRLSGKVGSVADPAFVMRRRLSVPPGGQVQLFAITAVADTREEAVDIVQNFQRARAVERTFQLAWNRVRIELRHLALTYVEAMEFQKLMGQMLYTPPHKKQRIEHIMANKKGQSSLWSFGISGERPAVLVHVDRHSQLPFVNKLLTGHEYVRRLGLLFELVILNESHGSYYKDLQDALHRASERGVDRFGEGAAGVYVIPVNQLQEDDLHLFAAFARLELRAGGPSLRAQLRYPERPKEPAPLEGESVSELSGWTTPVAQVDQLKQEKQESKAMPTMPAAQPMAAMQPAQSMPAAPDEPRTSLFYNGWGGFSTDGQAYNIVIQGQKHLPAPWINVMANPNFGTIISELGTGYTWWRNSRECKITPWSNDPVLDPPGEIGLLRDERSGHAWSLTASKDEEAPPYFIKHGRGFTRFIHERHGVAHDMSIFVPLSDNIKIMQVKLHNKSDVTKHLSVTYYAEWVLGVQRHDMAPYIVSHWHAEAETLIARNQFQETFRDATAFLSIYSTPPAAASDQSERTRMSIDDGSVSWTADRHEFIGRNGIVERPAAMQRNRLSNRTGVFNEPCGAVQLKLTLEPGEERTVIIMLGCEHSEEQVITTVSKYRQYSNCTQAWQEVAQFWEHTLQQTVVSTPSPEMDVLLNGWLLYQSIACRMWARTAFYQAGGAYGYRDQLQDALAVLHTKPELTRRQILLHAAHQYEEGDVQHWWHVETDRGIRTLFSDDLLWLPYVTARYVEHTGDVSVLGEVVPYITSEPLGEGEYERYEETVRSEQSGSVYEHCLRAIDKALSRIGEHGLPLIGVGDWNDGMNLVGAEGRGESVWLAWFICVVLEKFSEHCMDEEDGELVAEYAARREQLIAAANEHGWDGKWYRRAFTDAGTWLGSVHNEECRIDAIAQSWSIISAGAPPERAQQAMQSFSEQLVDREWQLIRLLTPPFDVSEPSPGYIQGYPPGIRENGAQYTHGVIWSIMALCMMGEGEQAFEWYNMLNPINHTRNEQDVRRYVGEPYVMAADVYTAAPHEGHAGWTWYTGASSWMYQVGLEYILGMKRRHNRLYVIPCIPKSWPGFTVTYRFGTASYVIVVSQGEGAEAGNSEIGEGSLQSDRHSVEVLYDDYGPYIMLQDDGQEHHVNIVVSPLPSKHGAFMK